MPVYLQDAFTDADGTALTSHTMNVGTGWTAVNGTLKILSNKATPNSDADIMRFCGLDSCPLRP